MARSLTAVILWDEGRADEDHNDDGDRIELKGVDREGRRSADPASSSSAKLRSCGFLGLALGVAAAAEDEGLLGVPADSSSASSSARRRKFLPLLLMFVCLVGSGELREGKRQEIGRAHV